MLESIRFQIREMLGIENAVKLLDEAEWKQTGVEKYGERIRREKEKKARTESRKLNLYEDFKDGILTQKEYVQMKQEYDRQIEVSEQALQSYEHELELLKNNKGSRQEWIKEFKKYENITVLDRSVVAALIKQVRVFEDKRIEVVFNFEEEMDRYGILAVNGKSGYVAGCGEGMVV